jgi:uncharacterized membrane-anchored protein
MVERPSRSRTKSGERQRDNRSNHRTAANCGIISNARGHQIDITLNYNSALPAECLMTFAAKRTLKRRRSIGRRLSSGKRDAKENMPESFNKIPEVTLVFWIIKIAATTLGETGGDTVTMTLDWGYLAGTALFLAALVLLVVLQIVAKKFHPFLYWATIIASTTFGTTMADFADRSLGVGYTGGSSILLLCLLTTLGLWYWSLGSISVDTVNTPKAEVFYWAAITFSQTLGTALGDWTADSTGLGYEGGALVFGAALAVVAAAYYWTNVSRVTLFWTAFILTRPLGATVGDFLDKPLDHGGLALSRPLASAIIAAFILGCLLVLPQRAGSHPGQPQMVRD